MRTNNLAVLVVAIVLGGLAAFLARGWLISRGGAGQFQGLTIVAAAKQLSFGEQLTEENVKEIPWAAGALPKGAFASKKQLFKDGKRLSLSVLQSDEPILSAKITGPGQRASLSTLLADDMRAITIRVDDVRGVAGFILPNDRVDVVLIRSKAAGDGTQKDSSDLLLQDVKVIGVDQIVSEQKDKPTVAKAVTLEVTPRQAQQISLATTVGHLSLILRKAGDSNIVANRTVTQSELIEGRPVLRQEASAIPLPVAKRDDAPTITDATVTIIRNLKSQDYKVRRSGQ